MSKKPKGLTMVEKIKRMLSGGPPPGPWPLDWPLWKWSPRDRFTIGNSVENILIVGGIGSCKTSGSGRKVFLTYLSNGYGALVLCVKPEEPALWKEYARMTGREDDLVIFSPGQPYRFDPLAFQLASGEGAGHTENLVQMLSVLLELSERNSGQNRQGEAYWKFALNQLVRNVIDLCVMATGSVSVPELYRIVISIPHSLDEVRSEDWRANSACYQLLQMAEQRIRTRQQKEDFTLVVDYFLKQLPQLSDKTRSVIESSFTSQVDLLNRGVLKQLFCTGTNIDPTAIERGKIIVVDLPLKTYGAIGLYAALLWKFSFMKSIERRNVEKSPRPVLLSQDEGQYLMLPQQYDMLFTSTARSCRVANVMLTQSISGVIATLGGGPAGKAEAEAYISNFGTKIFHANTDPVTNEFASTLIGRCKDYRVSGNNSYGGQDSMYGGNEQTGGSAGITEVVDYELQPREFTRLRCGGRANRYQADAVVIRNGMPFKATDRNWITVTFDQNQK